VRREYKGAAKRAAIGVLAAALLGSCVTIAPTPSSTPAPTPVRVTTRPDASATPHASAVQTTTPTPRSTSSGQTQLPGTPAPGATIDPALAAQIDAVVAQVPPIRELEPLVDVPYEFITREQFRDDLIDLQFSEIPEATRQAQERLLKRLGLLPADADLDQLLIDLYGGQVAAFYRSDTKRFYIIQRDQPFGPADKIIVSHEYTHALQDQHFDLEGKRIKDISEGDAVLGQLAAVEGDATLTMQLWANGHLSIGEAIQAAAESLAQLNDPVYANLPWVLKRQVEFPYAEGLAFITSLHDIGGYDAVNAALNDAIPSSTEQVLHPEKYTADEAPVPVSPPDRAPQLGGGWTSVYEQTMGEALMQVWAAGDEPPPVLLPGLPLDWPHADAVDGWGGDRLLMYEGPNGAWAIEWQTAWDTTTDAAEFEARVRELGSQLGGPSDVRTPATGQERRTVFVASDPAILSRLTSAN
jgi:hypothetical protein